jgi:hypothetical protein
MLEKRYTSLRSNKRSSSEKLESQKAELMTLVYHGCKFLKLQSRKASARAALESQLLARDFGPAMLFGLAKTALASHPVSTAASYGRSDPPLKRSSPFSGPPTTRIKSEPREQSVTSGSGGATDKKSLAAQLKSELTDYARGRSSADIQKWIDTRFDSQGPNRAAMGNLMSQLCRNCLLSGRGVTMHSRHACEEAGNDPLNPCPECLKTGVTAHHWRSKCPKRG